MVRNCDRKAREIFREIVINLSGIPTLNRFVKIVYIKFDVRMNCLTKNNAFLFFFKVTIFRISNVMNRVFCLFVCFLRSLGPTYLPT